MQEIAWQTVCAYPRSGVVCSAIPLAIKQSETNYNSIQDKDLSLMIYPNPTSNDVNIQSEERIFRVELFDMMGKKMNAYGLDTHFIQLDNLSQGIYWLSIKTRQGKTWKKILKK